MVNTHWNIFCETIIISKTFIKCRYRLSIKKWIRGTVLEPLGLLKADWKKQMGFRCLRNESIVWDEQNWRNGENSMPLVLQYGMTSNQKTDECEKHADWRKRMIVMCTDRNIRTKKFCKTWRCASSQDLAGQLEMPTKSLFVIEEEATEVVEVSE